MKVARNPFVVRILANQGRLAASDLVRKGASLLRNHGKYQVNKKEEVLSDQGASLGGKYWLGNS